MKDPTVTVTTMARKMVRIFALCLKITYRKSRRVPCGFFNSIHTILPFALFFAGYRPAGPLSIRKKESLSISIYALTYQNNIGTVKRFNDPPSRENDPDNGLLNSVLAI